MHVDSGVDAAASPRRDLGICCTACHEQTEDDAGSAADDAGSLTR